MPELSVTEEQLERIETVRTELEAAFLDGYGHMRRRDAVEYLLDTYTPPTEETRDGTSDESHDAADVEQRVREALDREVRDEEGDIHYPTLQSVARNTDGVKGSGTSAEEMYAAVLEAKVREMESGETDEVVIGLDETDREDVDDTGDADGGDASGAPDGDDVIDEAETEAEEENEEEDQEEAEAGATQEDDGDSSETGAGEAESNGGTSVASGGGSQLQAMMNLLKTHDDKWRKATSGDAPYEVDLPDGGTETARTKDDVKRILFVNY